MKKLFFIVGILGWILMMSIAEAAQPIKIGNTYDQTGPFTDASVHANYGVLVAVDEINAKGGINGRKVEMITIDGESSVEKSLGNVKRFIARDKVNGIMGPMYTGPSMAAMPVINKAKVVAFSGSGGNPVNELLKEKPQERQYLFSLSMGNTFAHEHNLTWLKRKGLTKIAVINPTNDLGESSNRWYQSFSKELGITILGLEKFDPKSLDMTPQLIKLKALSPQAIVTMSTGADASVMVRNFHQLEMKIPLVISDGNVSQTFIDSLEGKTEYVFGPGPKAVAPVDTLKTDDPMKAKMQAFINGYEKKFGKKIKSYNYEGIGYDGAMLIFEAIKKVGTDGEKMLNYIENLKGYKGANIVYNFSPTNHRGYTVEHICMFKIKDGIWQLAD
ncbi:MAG: ABC transporter substrate-binding protein [Deltaproteobacteria bacterium]|jgi:branched-chain amino acid transport system substrate-binding protein|nr:ABC transporter substrate-binding protein [Deltaproteobacteria bacterium]